MILPLSCGIPLVSPSIRLTYLHLTMAFRRHGRLTAGNRDSLSSTLSPRIDCACLQSGLQCPSTFAMRGFTLGNPTTFSDWYTIIFQNIID